jgi:hypothetical protein
MPTVVLLATTDQKLADAWELQLPPGRMVLRLGPQEFPYGALPGAASVVVLDAAAEALLPATLLRCPTIFVGEPRSLPFEQAKLTKRAKAYLSYEESVVRLRELLPLVEEVAEKQSMIDLLAERDKNRDVTHPETQSPSPADAPEFWDFLEAAVENIDTRERLVSEFRRASRHVLHASHAVFFLREADGFRADRGTSFFGQSDPLVAYFENHPVVVDGAIWESKADPVAELAVRNRLAMWGARLLVPIHDNGRLLGLIALGVRDDGRPYNESDRVRAVLFARLLLHCLSKMTLLRRLNLLADQTMLGAKYLPNTLILGPTENVPSHVPLVVRELIGRVRQTREACRVGPADNQPFRAGAGIIAETGGVWAYWEEASTEVHNAAERERKERKNLIHEITLTLSHEIGNALVSLTTLRQFGRDKPPPEPLVEMTRTDVMRLEALNRQLGLMQTLDEVDSAEVDIRDLAKSLGSSLSLRVEVGPDPVNLRIARDLVKLGLQALIETIAENRSPNGTRDLQLQLRSSGSGPNTTALLSVKGKNLELEGILPEPTEGTVPNQGRLGVFLAKEIIRLHRGEIHAGPGLEGTEILISLRSL